MYRPIIALGHLVLLALRHCEYLKHDYSPVNLDRSPFATQLCGGVGGSGVRAIVQFGVQFGDRLRNPKPGKHRSFGVT